MCFQGSLHDKVASLAFHAGMFQISKHFTRQTIYIRPFPASMGDQYNSYSSVQLPFHAIRALEIQEDHLFELVSNGIRCSKLQNRLG